MQHLERQTTSTYVATFGGAGSHLSTFLDLWSTSYIIYHMWSTFSTFSHVFGSSDLILCINISHVFTFGANLTHI
jgi:hypothetical protein